MKNTIKLSTPLNKTKQISKNKTKLNLKKKIKTQINTSLPQNLILYQKQDYSQFDLQNQSQNNIPYSHLVFSKKVKKQLIIKHVTDAFIGVNFAIKMRQLTHEELQKYKFKLPTEKNIKKTLFLDLDETLIHTSLQKNQPYENKIEIEFNGNRQVISFNLRPFCLEFLQSLSHIYQIYIFTASHDEYAHTIMNFLNKNYKSISGYLSREFCLKTSSGMYIKDLSRITNRNLNEMVIVDNLVYSFGNLIQNGIPILQFTEDKNDEELKFLQKYLVQGSKYDDIREYNRKSLRLREILEMKEYFQK